MKAQEEEEACRRSAQSEGNFQTGHGGTTGFLVLWGLQLLKLSNNGWAGLVWNGLRIPTALGREGAALEDLRGHS